MTEPVLTSMRVDTEAALERDKIAAVGNSSANSSAAASIFIHTFDYQGIRPVPTNPYL
jgi:hypothetical protein